MPVERKGVKVTKRREISTRWLVGCQGGGREAWTEVKRERKRGLGMRG